MTFEGNRDTFNPQTEPLKTRLAAARTAADGAFGNEEAAAMTLFADLLGDLIERAGGGLNFEYVAQTTIENLGAAMTTPVVPPWRPPDDPPPP